MNSDKGALLRSTCVFSIALALAVAIGMGGFVRSLSAQSGAVVNFSDVRQHIDGFGAADVWNPTLTDAQADLFFSATNGIGLSILRVGIDSNGNDRSAYSNATKAAARGAIVWAAPWTAPGAWKDNGSTSNGGHLLPADYDAWATRLAGFAATLRQKAGVPLYGVSVQNEPDFTASYDSMLYSNQEMANFVKVLGPKLAALSPRPKLMMPEVANWGGAWGFTSAVLGDSVAASYLDINGVHQYGGLSAPQTSARPIWETEMSSFEGFDPSIGNGLMVARWINDAFVTGGVSAWHYWWLIGNNADDEGLIGYKGNTQLTKRLYTVGNFSKFVRPGYVMVGVSNAPAGVSMTAFKDPSTGAFAIVAINQNASDTPLTAGLSGVTTNAVTPWVTSGVLDLMPQTNVSVSGGTFAYTLPASSVTTFVSSSSTAPPVDTTAPSAPGGLSASAVSSSQINLSWAASTDNVGVAGYRVYRGGAQVGTATNTSYSDTGLSPATTYSYTVAAYDAAGNVSATSANASATTQAVAPPVDTTAPSVPGGLTASAASSAQINLSWAASADNVGVAGYRIYRAGVQVATAAGTTYSDTQLAAATTYAYTVAAYDAAGNVSPQSPAASATTLASVLPPSGNVPAPWSSQDVGSPTLSGRASVSGGTFSVTGAGNDIWNNSDQFQFVFQTWDGDGQIVARVDSLQNTDAWAKGGLMVRADLTADAPNVMVTVTPGNGVSFQHRDTKGASSVFNATGGSITAPQWLRLVRSGSTITGYYSSNGSTWTQIGSATNSLPTHVFVGLAVTSHNASVTTTASFSNVTSSAAATTTPNQPPVLVQPANQTSTQNTSVSLPLSASDPDGNALTYSATGLPPTLAVNASTGLISGTVTTSGTYAVTAQVSDGSLINSKTFSWSVLNAAPVAPGITSVSPSGGPVGTSVTINGVNFGASASGASVTFNGTPASATSWSATRIVVPVPQGATTGPLVVSVANVAGNGVPFTVGTAQTHHAPMDVDGDGRSDIAVFNPATGSWDVLTSSTNFTGHMQFMKGGAGDIPITADFDGDGLTDIGVFHPSTSGWDVLLSSTNYTQSFTVGWGDASGMPVPGDYTGDGLADAATFRAGSWLILVSGSNNTRAAGDQLGASGDRPVIGDYDGDGIIDPAVYTPTTGVWQMHLSRSGQVRKVTLGISGDIPVPGDYDGDGKTDIAVFRPSTGQYLILTAASNFAGAPTTRAWGQNGDVPIVGDYDGDGLADLAVFRPSNGTWYISTSSSGFTSSITQAWGQSTETPMPSR